VSQLFSPDREQTFLPNTTSPPITTKEPTMAGTIARPTAFDVKDLHRLLRGYNDDELRQIPVVPEGAPLAEGSVYIDLHDPQPREFEAVGGTKAGAGHWYVAKSDVDYQLWNRLIGITNLERSGGEPPAPRGATP